MYKNVIQSVFNVCKILSKNKGENHFGDKCTQKNNTSTNILLEI
jgi:hypothetical protein